MARKFKSGGRQKGTPNKVTKDVRDNIRTFIEYNIPTLQEDFNQLEAKERILIIERLLKYVIPAKVDTLVHHTTESAAMILPDGTEIEI